jgi:hypothetical protein
MSRRQAQMDYILNGKHYGSVAARLLRSGFNMDLFRPYLGDGENEQEAFINVFNKQTNQYEARLTQNADATLLVREWIELDKIVTEVSRPRLRAWNDLRSMSQYTLPNGMAKTILQWQNMSDGSPATVSMDAIRRSEQDRVVFDLQNLPLPIIHKDFSFSARELEESRNGTMPLDYSGVKIATRKVAEQVESFVLGNSTYAYGGGNIYGYTNFPYRLTYSLTYPTTGGWTPEQTVDDVLAMRTLAQQHYHFGPYQLYCSLPWDPYMDKDYSSAKGDNTLRRRLGEIEGMLSPPRTLDYLNPNGFTIIMTMMDSETAEAVIGMDIQVVQWSTDGGFGINGKVLCILVPRMRADYNQNCGIVIGS